MSQKVSVSVVQAAPVLFDLKATLDKMELIVADCHGTQLILFPEAFISAYPRGLSFGTVIGSIEESGRALWKRYIGIHQ